MASLVREQKVIDLIQGELDKVNSHYAQVEQVKRFAILDHDFSQETGELTPSLKVKRDVVAEKYADVIESLYAGSASRRVAARDPRDARTLACRCRAAVKRRGGGSRGAKLCAPIHRKQEGCSSVAGRARRRCASVRCRSWGSSLRRRADGTLANMLLAAMVAHQPPLLGADPDPLPVDRLAGRLPRPGSVSLGILVAFLAVVAALFGALAVLTRIDAAWMLVRRAAGHDQRRGVLGRVFATAAVIGVSIFLLWFLVIHGPGSTVVSGQSGL